MSKLKEQVKQSLEAEMPVEEFDTSVLPSNPRKRGFKGVVVAVSAVLVVVLIAVLIIPIIGDAPLFDGAIVYANKNEPIKRSYTVNELKLIESSSFKKLNEVDYSTLNGRMYPVSDDFKLAVSGFASKVYGAVDRDVSNFSFSPLGLYEILSVAALASDNPTALAALDGLLGMDKELRKADFINAYKTDFFVNDDGTMQLYNASFQTSEWTANPQYVGALSEHFVEAYQLNFQNSDDVSKMLSWVDQKVKEKGFLKADDLDIDGDTAMMLFSTLYFDNKWATQFNTASTREGVFHAKSGDVQADFMHHTYFGKAYDYDGYIACYDYYRNGMKIKYLVPKEGVTEDIFTLTSGVNFIVDDEERKIVSMTEDGYPADLVVHLSLPKFSSECFTDFSAALKEAGLAPLFEKISHSFDYAFSNLSADTSVYMSYVKQKNKISFGEDGTVIKSVTFAELEGATSAAPVVLDTITVDLDCPFIYVIYDSNDLPIYVGHVDNPKV